MGKQVLEGNPYLDELICYHEKDSYRQFLQKFLQIRSHSFDIVIDFMNDPRSALFTLMCKAKLKVSTDSSRRWVYRQTFPRANDEETYIVDEKFNLLRNCGFAPKSRQLDFPWFQKHLGPVQNLFSQADYHAGDVGQIRVVLSPTHRRPIRKWALEKYCEIARRLVTNWGAKVTWVWGPGEEIEIDDAISHCKVKTYKAPATSFKELAALIAKHHLFVGNSNGPSHLAVANNICSLQLHGHTKASSWCPLNTKHQAIQSEEYGKKRSPTLDMISIEDVWEALISLKPEVEKEKSKQLNSPKKSWDCNFSSK